MNQVVPVFRVEENSAETIYNQLAFYLMNLIETKQLEVGDRLPSINIASKKFNVSRDTVLAAYKVLMNNNSVVVRPGKGFFVNSLRTRDVKSIFLLFDAMNQYKETLYRSLVDALGSKYETNIAFHYYNEKLFDVMVSNAKGKYNYYVLLPHFNVDVSRTLNKIPPDRLILLDALPSYYHQICAAVYQNFASDVYEGLRVIAHKLKKYKALHLVYADRLQFMPNELLAGLYRFAGEYQFPIYKEPGFDFTKVEEGHCYMAISERDLALFLKIVMARNWQLGREVGVMSYDNTPLKEVLAGGITTMTTDFEKMGKTAAGLIIKHEISQIANPWYLLDRGSL